MNIIILCYLAGANRTVPLFDIFRLIKGEAQTGRYVAMDLDDPPIDFTALARSMGVRAERAANLGEVRKALAAALAAEGPTLIDVTLDSSFGPV